MKSKNLVTRLKEKLKEKSLEELKVMWESGNNLDSVGMKVTDWLKQNNMKNLDQIRDEAAWELGFINYIEFERQFNNGEVEFIDVNSLLELYAKKRVKDVENYYKLSEDGK